MLNWKKRNGVLEAQSRAEHNGLPLMYTIRTGPHQVELDGEGLVPVPITCGRVDRACRIAETIEDKVSREIAGREGESHGRRRTF